MSEEAKLNRSEHTRTATESSTALIDASQSDAPYPIQNVLAICYLAPYEAYHQQCDIALSDAAIWSIVQQFTPSLYSSQLLRDPRKSAWKAFDENGQRMGIRSICVGLVCSWRQPSDLPETLQPSPLQLTTPHPIWLDRLPFPWFRDNFILLIHMIDMEDLYVDLFMKESFHVDHTKESHDLSAYSILPEFLAKWGYLCY